MSVLLSALPAHERPRERLRALGVEVLSEQELIALVLRNGRAGESAVGLAATLLARFGGINGLSRARPEELAAVPGVGAAKAASLVAAFRLGGLAGRVHETLTLRCAEDVAIVASSQLGGLRRERVLVLVCDSANRLMISITVSDGALDRSLMPLREILNAVLRHDGRAFAVAHNHPSGDPAPSDADRRATADLEAAAKTVGVRFLGHVIVAGDRWGQVT